MNAEGHHGKFHIIISTSSILKMVHWQEVATRLEFLQANVTSTSYAHLVPPKTRQVRKGQSPGRAELQELEGELQRLQELEGGLQELKGGGQGRGGLKGGDPGETRELMIVWIESKYPGSTCVGLSLLSRFECCNR